MKKTTVWVCVQTLFRPVIIDGEEFGCTRPVMRRLFDGEWQYRKPTLEEEADYVSATAW